MTRAFVAMLGLCVGVGTAIVACGSAELPDEEGTPNGGSGTSGNGSTPGFGNDPDPNNGGKPRECEKASCGAAGGTCTEGTCRISQNGGGVSGDQQKALKGGGKADSKFAWLYPYDQTVFPRGLVPPTLQFGGDAADASYVHIAFGGFEYEGFFGASNPVRINLPRAVWDLLTLTATASTDVKVEVTKLSGGKVTGPVTETWAIAQGSLAGTIYHETYNSKLIGGEPMQSPIGPVAAGVGIMKLEPGKSTAPTILKKGCANVCHTASADGSTLVASVALSKDENLKKFYNSTSASYDLKNGAATLATSDTQTFTLGALTPDGKLSMSATDYRTSGSDPGGATSALYDTHTGKKVSAPGWDGVIHRGGTMSFSPDGKHIAFGHNDGTLPNFGNKTIATMDFDQPTRTFSNLVDIAKAPDKLFIGWPAFTPDSRWVLYHSGNYSWLESDGDNRGDVFGVETQSKKVVRLDALDGYKADGTSYLPENDPNLNFSPTMLPVAVGGYFWAVFTSHRSYGNILASKVGKNEYGKLWVAAIDINAEPGKDPSHPAFFLDGQELAANNLRGFWVLSPCKSDGNACGHGDECCGGYCRGVDGAPKCVPPPSGCSNEYERCTTNADCCVSGSQCINSHCAQSAPK